jgi:hypothetical protein
MAMLARSSTAVAQPRQAASRNNTRVAAVAERQVRGWEFAAPLEGRHGGSRAASAALAHRVTHGRGSHGRSTLLPTILVQRLGGVACSHLAGVVGSRQRMCLLALGRRAPRPPERLRRFTLVSMHGWRLAHVVGARSTCEGTHKAVQQAALSCQCRAEQCIVMCWLLFVRHGVLAT